MQITDLIRRFKGTREKQEKAVFSTLCITENKLQTIFDKSGSGITLKQFMLLTMVRQSEDRLTFTQLGKLLGCSRQNIKKLAAALEQKGFITIIQNADDKRASFLMPTGRLEEYFEQTAALYGQKLSCLFQNYTDHEMEQLFTLLMKLYDEIDGLEAAGEAMTEEP